MALLPGDLFGGMFGDSVEIGSILSAAILDVQLFLAGLGLALGAFHRDARVPQVIAQWAHHMLFLGGLQDVIVFIVAGDRL